MGQGYPVAGGLSQSAVNEKAGAKTPLAIVITACLIAIVLLFLTGLFRNLPEAILAVHRFGRSERTDQSSRITASTTSQST